MVNETYTFWIAVYGAVLSTGLIFFNIITYYLQNTSRLKFHIKKGVDISPYSNSNDREVIIVNVTNVGKKPVTISDFGFEFKNGKDSTFSILKDRELPKKLKEGEVYSNRVDIELFNLHLNKRATRDKEPKENLIPKYVWVKDPTGKKHKSKDLAKVSDVYDVFKLE